MTYATVLALEAILLINVQATNSRNSPCQTMRVQSAPWSPRSQILRENVLCIHELSCYSCYSLVFGVPGAVMIVVIRKYSFTSHTTYINLYFPNVHTQTHVWYVVVIFPIFQKTKTATK